MNVHKIVLVNTYNHTKKGTLTHSYTLTHTLLPAHTHTHTINVQLS
jgi:hypothetical protein